MYMPDFFAIDFFKFPFLSIFRIHCNVYVCMNIYMQYNNSGSSSTVNKLPSQRPSEICRRSSTVSMDYTDSPLSLLSLAVAKGLTEVVSIIVADGAMVTTMDAVRKSPIFLSYFILYSISFFFFVLFLYVSLLLWPIFNYWNIHSILFCSIYLTCSYFFQHYSFHFHLKDSQSYFI